MDDKINQSETNKTNPKKRVLFIVTQPEWGGAQQFLYALISHLDRNKYEFWLASGEGKDMCFPDALKNIGVPIEKLRWLKREINPIADIRAVAEIRKLIDRLRPDVLFLNSSKAGTVGTLAAKRFPQLKVIYRIGGWSFNDPRPWLERHFLIWAEKYTAKFKDFVIVNNHQDFDQARRLKIKPRQRLELIYNGIDPYKLGLMDKDEAKIRLYELMPKKQAGFLHEGLIIGTIANFYPTKGLQYLIEAIKILNYKLGTINYKLILIGDGNERLKLESQIKDAGLQNSVFLAGMIPDAYRFLQAFDIFVLPSVKEGFPWALLEAMSAKLAVVATTVGANPEIIGDGKNGFLVPPRDPQALAGAIAKMAENEALRRELGIQAHQTVLHKFNLRKMVEQIEALL